MELGAWKLELGTWNLELGAWSLELGAWSLELGAWSLELGAWNWEATGRQLNGDTFWLAHHFANSFKEKVRTGKR